jgi:hypothetical protein
MTVTFPVTITTAEELRLIDQQELTQAQEPRTAVFDEFDLIRAHGMGVRLDEDNHTPNC